MKRDFDIATVLDRISLAVAPFPKAALHELADEGYRSPFEVLVACIISIRTRDETMLRLARGLFARARRPAEIAALSVEELSALISSAGLHEAKARQISAIARRVLEQYEGSLPCESEVLRILPGVGPKCANLVLGIACGRPSIGVDVHVHRITNRWGYVATITPEQTMVALEAQVPERYWIEINRLLVPFGKNICTGHLPHCSTCPILEFCRQVGVTAHR